MWRKCSDNLPDTSIHVLLWAEDDYYLGYLGKSGNWYYDCQEGTTPDEDPTHWMPLPVNPRLESEYSNGRCC